MGRTSARWLLGVSIAVLVGAGMVLASGFAVPVWVALVAGVMAIVAAWRVEVLDKRRDAELEELLEED